MSNRKTPDNTSPSEVSATNLRLDDAQLDAIAGAGWLSRLKQAQNLASSTSKKFSDTASAIISNI